MNYIKRKKMFDERMITIRDLIVHAYFLIDAITSIDFDFPFCGTNLHNQIPTVKLRDDIVEFELKYVGYDNDVNRFYIEFPQHLVDSDDDSIIKWMREYFFNLVCERNRKNTIDDLRRLRYLCDKYPLYQNLADMSDDEFEKYIDTYGENMP